MKFDEDKDASPKYIVKDCQNEIIEIGDIVCYYKGGYRKLCIGTVVKINEQSVRIKRELEDTYWDTQFGDKVFIHKKYEKDNI